MFGFRSQSDFDDNALFEAKELERNQKISRVCTHQNLIALAYICSLIRIQILNIAREPITLDTSNKHTPYVRCRSCRRSADASMLIRRFDCENWFGFGWLEVATGAVRRSAALRSAAGGDELEVMAFWGNQWLLTNDLNFCQNSGTEMQNECGYKWASKDSECGRYYGRASHRVTLVTIKMHLNQFLTAKMSCFTRTKGCSVKNFTNQTRQRQIIAHSLQSSNTILRSQFAIHKM